MNKRLIALAGGAGLATGLLIAPDKGSNTIKKIRGGGKKIVDGVKKIANGELKSVRKSIRSSVNDVKKRIRSRAAAAASATLNAEEKMHRRVRKALHGVAKSAGISPVKKTTSRNGAVKKSLRSKAARAKKAVATRRAAPKKVAKKKARTTPKEEIFPETMIG